MFCFSELLRSKAIVMPIYKILRMCRKYLRPVTYQLRNRRLMTMDNCQRVGTLLTCWHFA